MHVLLESLFIIVTNSCIIYMVGPASPVVLLGRLIVLITLESIVVLRVLVVRSAASCSGVMVCALQKTNNDALMGQATIAYICEQEPWVGPCVYFPSPKCRHPHLAARQHV